MKRYFFEADRKQWEKLTQPNYLYCTTAKADVFADDEEEARILAETKLHSRYDGTGVLLDNIRLVDIAALPADWSYGYDDDWKSGPTESIGDRTAGHVIT